MTAKVGERIAKRLSRSGVCSRREAERWVAEGRITVDGEQLTEPGTLVTASSDVRVDGQPIGLPRATQVWRYNKLRGLLCTNIDPRGRPTIFDHLPSHLPRVMSVGRLDFDSEGLLLLTNDGELARQMELPQNAWIRRYRVRVFGTPTKNALKTLKSGISINTIDYAPIDTTIDNTRASNSWLTVSLGEGKNREVRKVFEHLGYPVSRLIRTAYGPFQLGQLPRGNVRKIASRVIKDQLGTGI
ncbi:MAG: pseudouridine synthase [Pseudomonadota bacterium]|nr:pseudouridine synthase [Pseudomonadota bacterium]